MTPDESAAGERLWAAAEGLIAHYRTHGTVEEINALPGQPRGRAPLEALGDAIAGYRRVVPPPTQGIAVGGIASTSRAGFG